MAGKLAQFILTLVTLFLLSPKPALAQTPTPITSAHFELVSNTPGYLADVAVSGNLAYTASWEDIFIYDISDPTNLGSPLGSYHAPGCFFWSVDVWDNLESVAQANYSCSPRDSLFIFDVSNPEIPIRTGEEVVTGAEPGGAWEIDAQDGYVYLAFAQGGLRIVKVSSTGVPGEPVSFTPEGVVFLDVKAVGNTLYLTDLNRKIWILDITNRLAPSVLDTLDFSSSPSGVAIQGDYAYVTVGPFSDTGEGALRVVNVSDPSDIFEAGAAPLPITSPLDPPSPIDVEVTGNFAFVADDAGELMVFDISTPATPQYITSYHLGDIGNDGARLTIKNDLIFVAGGAEGLTILRFTGLEEPPCSLSNFGDINGNPLRQNDPDWGGLPYGGRNYKKTDGTVVFLPFIFYGNNKDTIGAWGCKLTSAAMIVNYYAQDQDKSFRTDPKVLNEWLQRNGGYNSGDSPLPSKQNPQYWNTAGVDLASVVKYAKDNGVLFSLDGSITQLSGKNGPIESIETFIFRTKQRINNYLCELNPVILGVNNNKHFVDATGNVLYNGVETWRIHDPLWNDVQSEISTLKAAYNNIYTRIDLTSGNHARRHLTVVKYSPVEMYITDPQGRKAGLDANSNTFFEEIPNASYGEEYLGADDGGGGLIHFGMLDIVDPNSGEFTLSVVGTGRGQYGLEIRGTDYDTDINSVSISGDAIVGQVDKFRINYSSDDSQELQVVREVLLDIKPEAIINVIRLSSLGVIPVAIITTPTFDATTINPLSVRFGLNGISEIHGRGHIEDVNNDGLFDLLLHFSIQQSGLDENQTEACLKGKTFEGENIEGCDLVKTL